MAPASSNGFVFGSALGSQAYGFEFRRVFGRSGKHFLCRNVAIGQEADRL